MKAFHYISEVVNGHLFYFISIMAVNALNIQMMLDFFYHSHSKLSSWKASFVIEFRRFRSMNISFQTYPVYPMPIDFSSF